jgi:hypothetical protein
MVDPLDCSAWRSLRTDPAFIEPFGDRINQVGLADLLENLHRVRIQGTPKIRPKNQKDWPLSREKINSWLADACLICICRNSCMAFSLAPGYRTSRTSTTNSTISNLFWGRSCGQQPVSQQGPARTDNILYHGPIMIEPSPIYTRFTQLGD